jgi:hypothetical protein
MTGKVTGFIPGEVTGFSICLILPAALWLWAQLSLEQKSVPGRGKKRSADA